MDANLRIFSVLLPYFALRRGCAIALCLLWLSIAVHAQDVARDDAIPFHSNDITQPLDPLATVSEDGHTHWRAAVALFADPVDTRLARSFDIQIATLVRSFQFQGFVLQGHALPWRADGAAKPSRLHEVMPGVLVFRNDRWRDPRVPNGGTEYIVVFLVGESPVFGIQRTAFCHAVIRARAMNAGARRPLSGDTAACAQLPGAKAAAAARQEGALVPVLGPMFSGSMTSLAEAAKWSGVRLQLLSPSATVDSNRLIPRLVNEGLITFRPFARWSQAEQLATLFAYLRQEHGICPGQVVILAEESAFGQGAIEFNQYASTPGDRDDGTRTCERRVPRRLQFPQNIAAIRAEHAQLDARNKGDLSLLLAPRRNLELDMQDAGTSLDLPPVYQPSMTSRSDELSLQQTMDLLSTYIRPKAVLIVATDVRDRLYMLATIRGAVPAALPVVLEGDHLLAHPDYRRANRGTLMVQNSPLQLCYARMLGKPGWHEGCQVDRKALGETRRFGFATDYAAGLFRASQELIAPGTMESGAGSGTTLSVVTLAGLQRVPFALASRGERDGERHDSAGRTRFLGNLIASETRKIAFSLLLPFALLLGVVLLICAAWLWCSSRPGRTILPPLRYAIRELGWWLRNHPWLCRTAEQRALLRRRCHPLPPDERTSNRWLLLLLALALLLVGLLGWEWWQVMWWTARAGDGFGDMRPSGGMHRMMLALHGRDALLVSVLLALYAWFAVLVIARVHAWNRRCRHHWREGSEPPERDPHSKRRYHGTSLTLALSLSLPTLLYWYLRDPQTVDPVWLTTGASFLLTVACLYFLTQACLQMHRLFHLGRTVRDYIIDEAPRGAIPRGWPTPRQLGTAPQSPVTVLFRDFDWHALRHGGSEWPWLPAQRQRNALVRAFDTKELEAWRHRTVAEMKFGLICVRSCLGVAFAAPLALLLMILVHPFAFEWEHSLVALCLLGLAFFAITMTVLKAEQAPLIGQMFTEDGSHVSYKEVFRTVGGKLLLVLAVTTATLSPHLGGYLQNLIGLLRV